MSPAPVLAGFTLRNLLAQLRLDLFDTDSSAYRWSDPNLMRAIDRSVDRYSQIAPNLVLVDISTATKARLYAIPADCWWVEAVEFPAGLWPRTYVQFRETTLPADGTRQIELQLNNNQLPADASGTIELTCAYKHELDNTGTTIPEKHWDCITIGAEAGALLAYLTSTNDNFEFVDGQLRDRVDDSAAPAAWRAQFNLVKTRYQEQLDIIRNEQTAKTILPPQWGDKPARYDRL